MLTDLYIKINNNSTKKFSVYVQLYKISSTEAKFSPLLANSKQERKRKTRKKKKERKKNQEKNLDLLIV